MDTENLRFNLFEIFDNMMGDKKKLRITNNLDVYTTRTGDIHRVIRVHWEVLRPTKKSVGTTASAETTIRITAMRSFSPTPLRDCMRQLTTSTNFRKTQSDTHHAPPARAGHPIGREIKC